MTYTLTIPAPCKFLNSNQRLHPIAKAKLAAQWRAAAHAAAQDAEPVATPVRIIAHVIKPRGGRWDPGNWYPSAKACVDGLVDAGVLVDDSHREVIGPDMRAGIKGPPALQLTITEIGARHMIRSHWEDQEWAHDATTDPPDAPESQKGTSAHPTHSRPAEEQLAAEQWAHLKKYYAGEE